MALAKELSSGSENANTEVVIAFTVDDNSIVVEVQREQLNNNFRHPINTNSGATGTVIEEADILYVQKCLCGELYYEPCNPEGDTDNLTTILAHSTNPWSLCDSEPSFKDNPMVTDNDFDKWLLEDNRQMAYKEC